MLARDMCWSVGTEKAVCAKRFIDSCWWRRRRLSLVYADGIHAGCGARDKWLGEVNIMIEDIITIIKANDARDIDS